MVVLSAMAGAGNAGSALAQPATSKEYEIKAAFLFNFAQFVEWPAAAFADARDPIRICVLGANPFGGTLQRLVEGETINRRTLEVASGSHIGDVGRCHLLFISQSERWHMAEILDDVAPEAVLTVSEVEDFAAHGGNLNFYIEDDRIRFEVNPESARRQGLRLSAQLLKLGRIVPSSANLSPD